MLITAIFVTLGTTIVVALLSGRSRLASLLRLKNALTTT